MEVLKGTLTRILGKSLQKQLPTSPFEDSLSRGDLIMTPHTAQWRDISLKVDLYNATSHYLSFLARCRLHDEYMLESVLRQILYRYEHFWLPLLAEWQQADLEPPLDIHWIWHLHMLLPTQYAQFCNQRYGRLLPHRIRLNHTSHVEGLERTRGIWKDNYPNEPFEVNYNTYTDCRPLNGSKLTDLISFARDQRHFLYQVVLPHYADTNFLFRAVDRYKQLLLMKSQKPQVIMKLPVDVQLIWRVHKQHPVEYIREMQNQVGRQAVETLGDCDTDVHAMFISDSNDVWRTFFQEPLFLSGTSFRGFDMSLNIKKLPKKLYAPGIIDSCCITIDELCVSDLWTNDRKLVVECRRLGSSSFTYDSIFKSDACAGKPISNLSDTGLVTTDFEAKIHRGMEFHISKKKGALCTSGERHLTSVFYNPQKHFHNQSFVSGVIAVEVPKISYTDPKLSFTMKVKAALPTPHTLSMDRDPFTPSIIPNALKPFVGSLPQWTDAINQQQDGEEFLVAKHRLKSKRGMLAFGVHLTRQDEAELSSVMLYHNNEHLVSVAHTIGSEQLPRPEQVQETLRLPLTYDQEEGDQAMLIRNHVGDWAVCVARWQVTNAVTGEGQVMMKVHFLQTQSNATYTIRDDELQNITCGLISIDMPSGRLEVDAACEELAEHITLAFSIGMLFVTCQRRSLMSILPVSTPTGSIRSSRSTGSLGDVSDVIGPKEPKRSFGRFSAKNHMNRKKLNKRRKMSASFTFLLASGLQIDVAVSGSVRSGSKSSLYSRGKHVDVTAINFDPVSNQQQIEDHVKKMIEGGHQQYKHSSPADKTDQTYWDIRL